MIRKRKLSEAEEKLLKEQMAGVRPIARESLALPAKPQRATAPVRQTTAPDKTPALPESALGESIHWLKSGQQKRVLRKLRSPGFSADATIDLHGLRAGEARSLLEQFLVHCRQQRLHSALLIHGKGFGSRTGQPVLKNLCVEILLQCPEVLAFHSAGYRDGGTGALRVLLATTDHE